MRKCHTKTTIKLLTVLAVILAAAAANAADYKPMIRFDRIWESVCWNSEGDTIKCMKFDGTEEICGKTYHKIVTFRKSIALYQIATDSFIYETTENIDDCEGYLREQDGIVYTLVAQTEDNESGRLYTSESDLNEGESLCEKPIYNFCLKQNDEIELYSFVMKSGMTQRFKVLECSAINIDGEECLSVKLTPLSVVDIFDNESYGGVYSVIEGIGTSIYGCLNYTEHIAQPAYFWYYNQINRVFDFEYNIVFENEYGAIYKDLTYDGLNINAAKDLERTSISVKSDMVSYGTEGIWNALCIYNLNGTKVKSESGIGGITVAIDMLQPGVYIAIGLSDEKIAVRRKFTVK